MYMYMGLLRNIGECIDLGIPVWRTDLNPTICWPVSKLRVSWGAQLVMSPRLLTRLARTPLRPEADHRDGPSLTRRRVEVAEA